MIERAGSGITPISAAARRGRFLPSCGWNPPVYRCNRRFPDLQGLYDRRGGLRMPGVISGGAKFRHLAILRT